MDNMTRIEEVHYSEECSSKRAWELLKAEKIVAVTKGLGGSFILIGWSMNEVYIKQRTTSLPEASRVQQLCVKGEG
jgi:hypothetical protein